MTKKFSQLRATMSPAARLASDKALKRLIAAVPSHAASPSHIGPTIRWSVPILFGSALDEKAFFSWLESIPGVKRVEGRELGLLIYFRSKRLSKTAIRELIAIYERYDGDMGDLASLGIEPLKLHG